METPKPTKQHEWLKQLVGEWTYECPAPPDHDKPQETMRGTEIMRSLGDVWFVGEGKMSMPGGGEGTAIITLGYDPSKGRFVGSWIGTMMLNMWVYDGELDASGKKLILSAEGPSFMGEAGRFQYRDTIEIIDENHRTLSGSMLGKDGKWTTFMVAHYHRVK